MRLGSKITEAQRQKWINASTGRHHTEEARRRIGLAQKGKTLSEEVRRKISKSKIGCVKSPRAYSFLKGKDNPNWIADRSKLAKRQERNDSTYKEWRMSVWVRDGFKCRIANKDCGGRIEAHHILIWSEHPELRYEINNGITLCHAHHPRKRAEEKQLVPYFMGLIETKV